MDDVQYRDVRCKVYDENDICTAFFGRSIDDGATGFRLGLLCLTRDPYIVNH